MKAIDKNSEMMTLSLIPDLQQVGYYISPVGGAASPSRIHESMIYVEIITQGRVRHPEDDSWAKPGSVFFHQAGETTVFQSPSQEHYECVTLSFTTTEDHGFLSTLPRSYIWEDRYRLDPFCQEVLHAAHYQEMDLQELGPYIWATLYFQYSRSKAQLQEVGAPEPVAHAVRALTEHPEKKWELEDLADLVGWSTSHLHHEFKRHTGKSPHQFLIAQRMAEARHRLVCGKDSIKLIAYEVGFSNTESFCRQFKRVHGQTAGEFRMYYQDLPAQF